MTPDQLAYWLRGYFELLEAGAKVAEKPTLNAEQTEMISRHVKMVFAERAQPPSTSLSIPYVPPPADMFLSGPLTSITPQGVTC